MSPIITHEDELDLAKFEKQLVGHLKKVAKLQTSLINTQKNYADLITKESIARENLNIMFRDVIKQMQTLVREKRSNIKEEEVNTYQTIIRQNDQYVANAKVYLNAIKDLVSKKEDLIKTKIEFADALDTLAAKRSGITKQALKLDKMQNKMIQGEKIHLLEQQMTDAQRDFDRTREFFIKKMEAFVILRDDIKSLWIKIKDSITELS